MGRWRKTSPCEQASQWISLRLDGELSELEATALERHLEACPRCSGLARRVGGYTWLLRQQPLVEIPRPVKVETPRSQKARIARRGGAVLGLAAVLGAVAAVVVLPHSGGPTTSALSFRSLAEQKRFAHVEHVRTEPETFITAIRLPAVPSFAARALG